MTKRALIVAAHPDDEVLGMGGTMARHHAMGDHVGVLFMTDGVGSRGPSRDDEVVQRQHAAQEACAVLGTEILDYGRFPDNALDSVPLLDVVKRVEEVGRAFGAQIVYTHHGGDLNVDHRITFQAVLTAFRPQPGEKVRELRAFEVASSTEWSHCTIATPFVPDTYIDIADHVEQLVEAYSCYEREARPDPHARSIEALRIKVDHRGRQVGMMAAEAFTTVRRLL